MKLKDYKNEYVFIEDSDSYGYLLIATDEVARYVKENELVFCKIYGTKKTEWLENIEYEISDMIITDGEDNGIEDIQDRLDFENEDYKKGVEYLQKFIDRVREGIYDIDLNTEIEVVGADE